MSSAPSFSVKGKVVLVTGGAKGIGKMITTGYVAAGAKVYISSRDKKSCDAVAQELTKLGPGSAHSIPADLASYEGVEALVAELSKREKHLNVLVNNAGNNWGAPLEEYPDAAWDRVLGLNLKRVFTLTQKCVPLLLASLPKDASEEGPWNDPARIINIGSVDGIRVPSLETYAYSSSKAALHQLSRVFAAQLGRRGVTSNTIACGPFESKSRFFYLNDLTHQPLLILLHMLALHFTSVMAATLEAGRDLIVAGVPLGRIGSPQDVSGTCIFLSSPAGAWVNGATIALDGGALVGGKL